MTFYFGVYDRFEHRNKYLVATRAPLAEISANKDKAACHCLFGST